MGRQLLYAIRAYPWVYNYKERAFLQTPCNNVFGNAHCAYLLGKIFSTYDIIACCTDRADQYFFDSKPMLLCTPPPLILPRCLFPFPF